PPASAPADLTFRQDPDFLAAELAAARREGVGFIVGGGHPDMGRNINFLRQLSMNAGLPIVARGGFYAQPFYPKELGTMNEDQIVRALIKQVETEPVGVFG